MGINNDIVKPRIHQFHMLYAPLLLCCNVFLEQQFLLNLLLTLCLDKFSAFFIVFLNLFDFLHPMLFIFRSQHGSVALPLLLESGQLTVFFLSQCSQSLTLLHFKLISQTYIRIEFSNFVLLILGCRLLLLCLFLNIAQQNLILNNLLLNFLLFFIDDLSFLLFEGLGKFFPLDLLLFNFVLVQFFVFLLFLDNVILVLLVLALQVELDAFFYFKLPLEDVESLLLEDFSVLVPDWETSLPDHLCSAIQNQRFFMLLKNFSFLVKLSFFKLLLLKFFIFLLH